MNSNTTGPAPVAHTKFIASTGTATLPTAIIGDVPDIERTIDRMFEIPRCSLSLPGGMTAVVMNDYLDTTNIEHKLQDLARSNTTVSVKTANIPDCQRDISTAMKNIYAILGIHHAELSDPKNGVMLAVYDPAGEAPPDADARAGRYSNLLKTMCPGRIHRVRIEGFKLQTEYSTKPPAEVLYLARLAGDPYVILPVESGEVKWILRSEC